MMRYDIYLRSKDFSTSGRQREEYARQTKNDRTYAYLEPDAGRVVAVWRNVVTNVAAPRSWVSERV